MSRMLLLVALLGLSSLSTAQAGDEKSKAVDAKRVDLEDQLRVLLNQRGRSHPEVVALQERIALLKAEAAQGEQVFPKGLLVVISKQKILATLKDASIRSIGNRKFVVGVEVDGPKITKPIFAGMVIWIPLDDVIQMVEVKAAEEK